MVDFDQLKIRPFSKKIPQSGSATLESKEKMRSPLKVFQPMMIRSLAIVATRFSSTVNGLLKLEKFDPEIKPRKK